MRRHHAPAVLTRVRAHARARARTHTYTRSPSCAMQHLTRLTRGILAHTTVATITPPANTIDTHDSRATHLTHSVTPPHSPDVFRVLVLQALERDANARALAVKRGAATVAAVDLATHV